VPARPFNFSRTLKFLSLLAFLALLLWIAVFLLTTRPTGLRFAAVSYSDLPGWSAENAFGAKPALVKSCQKLRSLPAGKRLPGASIGGRVDDWGPACRAVTNAATAAEFETVLRTYFTPLEVSAGGTSEGTFTGYYEALLHGSLTRSERFNVPLYARPPELVMVDLGRFRKDLAGQRIAGSVKNGRLQPYPDRAAIEEGALNGRDLEVLWVDSAVDAYFLQVQGSGRVQMPDGSFLGIGYAAQNGHANRLIGRHLIETGAIPREKMSGQAIRQWLASNPEKIRSVLNTDPSFVFFRPLENGDGPYGSAGVSLTPGRSLAVDRVHLPLHAPVWLDASHPDPNDPTVADVPMKRLMVAQDTGGAITGEVRGDVFWGFGDDAEETAGRMANAGRYWLLLPTALAEAAEATGG